MRSDRFGLVLENRFNGSNILDAARNLNAEGVRELSAQGNALGNLDEKIPEL
jgi:hypothetical protein